MQIELLKNYLISAIRTFVPFLVGLIVSWLATQGVTLDDNTLGIITLVLEGVFGMVYYLLVRWLEHLNYRFGWLLGYARMPVYTIPAAASMLSKSDDEGKQQ
jgi:hypothetical protein